MRRTLLLVPLLLVPALGGCGGGGDDVSAISQEVPVAGGTVSLSDDVTLHIPPGALESPAEVTIARASGEGVSTDGLEATVAVGAAFDIDLGGQELSKPATLEIAFDPTEFPEGTSTDGVFLGYYDEGEEVWTLVPGKVDAERNVVAVQTDHLSRWNPFTWNWDAWIAVLNNALTTNLTDFFGAVALLTDECPQSGTTVSVDSREANNVVQGCVERDDPTAPQLRIVNPKSFFFEVKPISGGNSYPSDTVLGPGEDLEFAANTADPTPLIVSAEITQKAGVYLVVHLIIQMLPGLNQFDIQGTQIGCITERLRDVSYLVAASEALLVERNSAAAAEHIGRMLLDADAMRRFINTADDCSYGVARTWSLEGLQQLGAATATIMSATDFVSNYLLNYRSEIAFAWIRPTPTPRVPTPSLQPVSPALTEREQMIERNWLTVEAKTHEFFRLLASGTPADLDQARRILVPEGQRSSWNYYNIGYAPGIEECSWEVSQGEFRALSLGRRFSPRHQLSALDMENIERGLAPRDRYRVSLSFEMRDWNSSFDTPDGRGPIRQYNGVADGLYFEFEDVGGDLLIADLDACYTRPLGVVVAQPIG